MATPRYLRMKHLGWQDENPPNAMGVYDAGTSVPMLAFCGERVQASDILWLDAQLQYDLSVDKRDMCQPCLAEWVERRLLHPVNVLHSSLGRSDGRALCGASKTYQTYQRGLDQTTCTSCRRIIKDQ